MTDRFKALVDGESKVVDSIIAAMFHSKKDEARRFLMFMNNIVDYYLVRPQGEKVCFPIVYIPNAPDWAREVFLKFLIIKLSLYYNEKKRLEFKERVDSILYEPTNEIILYHKRYEIPFRKYIRQIFPNLGQSFLGTKDGKNLIFCREKDIMVSREDKNKYISEFFGTIDDVCSKDNLTICQNVTASDIRKQIKENNYDVHIDNIFIFYTNNDQCNSLTDSAFRLMKDQIKNCFIFDFSDKPLRLYKSLKNKLLFCHKFPKFPEKEALQYEHYITISEEESRYIFRLESNNNSHYYLPDDQLFFNGMIGEVIGISEHPILDRIHLSLCLDKIQSNEYIRRMREAYPSFPQDFYQLSVTYQLDVAQKRIIPRIKRFISNSRSIGIILPYDATNEERDMFRRVLPEVRNISFYTLADLKKKNNKNNIQEDKVLNFVYRPHYANTTYHKYPNSFDSYMPNSNQLIREFINGFTFGNMYLWDKYEYDKHLSYLLNSEYRKTNLGEMEMPYKPKVERATGETDFEDERTNSRSVKSYKIVFEDGSKISIPETELVIVEDGSGRYICKMSELMEEEIGISIQKLDDVKYVLTEFMEKETLKADTNEKLVRKYCYEQGLITEEERDSGDYLWKILLSHRVDKTNPKIVHEEIMSVLKENDRIQLGAFKQWYTKDSVMMLPLQRVCQKRLMEYLGLQNTPYLGIMRNKKRAAKNGTRQSNSMTDKFMLEFLFQDIDSDKFDEFYESDINDILQIESVSDLETLISMIKETINLKKIKTIK